MRGERADLRISSTDWLSGDAPPADFSQPVLLPADRALIGEAVERVREIERLAAREIRRSPSGQQIIDFGQNFAGVVRIRLRGEAGTVVRLGHSEVIGIDGEVDLKYHSELPGVRWSQTDEVTLAGEDIWWSPWFTIHGFRYVSVGGLGHELELADMEGIVLSSALESGGEFACSDERLNRLYRNVFWSLRSNFTDTPTDCPTRERAGWTGDIQLFAPTSAKLADVQAYLRRYLANLAIEQMPGGEVPIFIPSQVARPSGMSLVMMRYMAEAAGWGDAAVLLPWTLYQHYGDRAVLEAQYASMKGWVDCMARRAARKPGLWRKPKQRRPAEIERYIVDSGFDFGEWLRPGTEGLDKLFDGLKLGGVVATAYLAHSARILAQVAAILGRSDDEARYRDLAAKTRHAWRTVYIQPDGTIGTDRQDDYVRALAFDLLEPGERAAATARLVALIEAAGDHLGTGFLSTPMLLPVLADNGRMDVAWRLLLQTTNPSWLHQIERGATTVWETWEGYKANGAPDQSHNHYTFGAVANFLIERIVGLAPAEPGYRTITVQPGVSGPLTRAQGSVRTPYGLAAAQWQVEDGEVTLRLSLPPGTRAEVDRGDAGMLTVESGDHTLQWRH
jgi:alpha-L-rhamnosidase